MTVDRTGVTRLVFLTRHWAFKVPNFINGWRLFLQGLLANMQEREFSRAYFEKLCPVVWSIPGGWLVVMPRCRVMTDAEFQAFDAKSFVDGPDYVVPAEAKSDSFGYLDGRIVAIDYGGAGRSASDKGEA